MSVRMTVAQLLDDVRNTEFLIVEKQYVGSWEDLADTFAKFNRLPAAVRHNGIIVLVLGNGPERAELRGADDELLTWAHACRIARVLDESSATVDAVACLKEYWQTDHVCEFADRTTTGDVTSDNEPDE